MEDPGKEIVSCVLGELLRAPEPVRDIEVDRALTRLQAARSDTPYLLLHRLLVLETALLQLRQREAALADAAPAAGAARTGMAAKAGIAGIAGKAAPAAPTRSFLRDAAVVTLGVVAGQAVWGSMSTEVDGALGDLGELGELGDLGDLLG